MVQPCQSAAMTQVRLALPVSRVWSGRQAVPSRHTGGSLLGAQVIQVGTAAWPTAFPGHMQTQQDQFITYESGGDISNFTQQDIATAQQARHRIACIAPFMCWL